MLLKLVLSLTLLVATIYLYIVDKTAFTFALPIITVSIVSYIYFLNNPVGHKRKFRFRAYGNWLPLGLTYASLYMGRYNLTVAKTAFGEDLMSKNDFGLIFMVGSIVYGCSFLVNGPITDRIGGKITIIISAVGTALANLLLGYYSKQAISNEEFSYTLLWPFVFIYAANMYFQSFGAVSIVKVNAAWFHIKERGVFGGIFGTLISLGIYLAFDVTGRVLELTKAEDGQLRIWWAFYVPVGVLAVFALIDLLLIKDTPSKAGYKDFPTGDAGADDKEQGVIPTVEIFKHLLTTQTIRYMIAIEFCSGVLRNGIMHWGKIYSKQLRIDETDIFLQNWGLVLMIAGVTGGFFAGVLSDKLFQSRRGPSAFFLYAGMFCGCGAMVLTIFFQWNFLLGFLSFFTSMCVIGVHGMLSGVASMDFGGKKAAATTAGVLDGFVYLGTGFQSGALGYLTSTQGWRAWPIFLVPFTLIGLYFTRRIWFSFPNSNYISSP